MHDWNVLHILLLCSRCVSDKHQGAATSLGLAIKNNSGSIMCFDTPALYQDVGFFSWSQSYLVTSKPRSLTFVPVPASAALFFLYCLLLQLNLSRVIPLAFLIR